MAVSIIGPKFYAWDRNGNPLAFGKLYTYEARTNVPKDTYQSEDQVAANTNPVILNGEGYANVYLDGSYKVVLKDSDDNDIWSADPVTASQAEEWQGCFSASYISSTRFQISGNVTEQYEAGRSVRINNGAANYIYSFVTDVIFSGGNTQVTINDAEVPTNIISVCASIVSSESTKAIEDKFDKEIEEQRNRFLNTDQDNSNIKEAIACIPRCVDGVFVYLNDAGHEPIGVSIMEQPDDYLIRMRYGKDYEQVNTMIITVDNELAPYGVFCGGDVGTNLANFTPQAPLEGFITKSGAGGTWFGTALFKNEDVTIDYTDDILKLTHPIGWPAGCVPVVSPVYNPNNNNMPRIGVGFSNNEVTITPVTDVAGLIRWNGSAFEFWNTFPTYMSDNVIGTDVVLSNPSVGILRVTHPETTNYDLIVSSRGGNYHAKEVTVTSTSFDIKFYDYAGNEITTPDSNMQVWIKKKCDVKGKIPDGTQYLIKAPLAPPKSANFSDIAGNNFWVAGIMENPQ